MRKNMKMLIGIGVIIAVFGLLFSQGLQANGGVGVYLTIEEALKSYELDKDKFIQMEGKVVASTVEYKSMEPSLKFDLTDDAQNKINVIFYDIKPDNFDSGYPIIVEGRFNEDKIFLADKILVKCPSKYEEELGTQE